MPISILVVKFESSLDEFLQRFSCEVGIAAHRQLQSFLKVLNNFDLGSDPSSHLALKLFLSQSQFESFSVRSVEFPSHVTDEFLAGVVDCLYPSFQNRLNGRWFVQPTKNGGFESVPEDRRSVVGVLPTFFLRTPIRR